MKPSVGSKKHTQWVTQRIRECAEDLGIPISQLRRDAFLDWQVDLDDRVTPHDILQLGGWARVRPYAGDEAGEGIPEPEVLGERRGIQHRNTHRNALERHLGDVNYISSRLRESLADAVKQHPAKISNLTKPKPNWAKTSQREIVLHLSDTHFGQCVDPAEVVSGSYNWTLAARRMGYLAHEVAGFRREHRQNTTLRLVVNGDLIEGRIHNDDRGVDMMAAQIDGARQILTSVIDYLRHHFPRIEVMCQSGNHERWPFRGPGRPTAQKYDSATTVVLRGVEQIFRGCEDVRFHLPVTPFSTWQSCGWTYFATHGDDVFQIGNPSKAIQYSSLPGKLYNIETWLRSQSQISDRVHVVMLGHYHNPLITHIPGPKPQAFLTVNGCASGQTAYSQTIGVPSSSPVQTFWEATEHDPVDGFRMLVLDDADVSAAWEKIVPVPVPIGSAIPKCVAAPTDFYAFAQAITSSKKR